MSTPLFDLSPGAPAWDATAGPAAFTGPMWPAGRGLLHTVFADDSTSNFILRASNAWPKPATVPLRQWIDTDAVAGYSWSEVRVLLHEYPAEQR